MSRRPRAAKLHAGSSDAQLFSELDESLTLRRRRGLEVNYFLVFQAYGTALRCLLTLWGGVFAEN